MVGRPNIGREEFSGSSFVQPHFEGAAPSLATVGLNFPLISDIIWRNSDYIPPSDSGFYFSCLIYSRMKKTKH